MAFNGKASQTQLKPMAQEVKEAKVIADAAQKAASQSLDDFMPDLKKAGDALDEAKEDLKDFEDVLTAFGELKDLKEGDFPPAIQTGSYYEKIDGMKLDRAIIDACRTAVQDGQISVDDAKRVYDTVADGNKETRCERWTVLYCLQEFKWAQAAHDLLIEELKKVPQEGISGSPAKKARTSSTGYYETIDGFKCDRAIIDICREAAALNETGDAPINDEYAQKVWAKASDANKVTDAEKWTVRYCLSNFKWEPSAYALVMDELHKAD